MADPHTRTGSQQRAPRPVGGRAARAGTDKPPERRPWRVEGEREGGSSTDPDKPSRNGGGMSRVPGSRRFWRFLLVLLILNIIFAQLIPSSEDQRLDVPYTFFREQVEAGNVQEVNAKNDVIQGVFRTKTKFEKKGPEKDFETVRPTFAQDDELLELLLDKKVEVNARPIDEGRGFLATLLLSFGPTLLFVGLAIWFLRRSAAAAGGGALALGRSKAKRYDASTTRVSFEDVAGIDEVEDELKEIVDFLKNPDRYRKLGAAFPKGVLLSGQPGTGKTLLRPARVDRPENLN
jgi:cell division protease FtsH